MSITVQHGDNAWWGAQAVSPSWSAVAAEEWPDRAVWEVTPAAEGPAYPAEDETGAVGHTMHALAYTAEPGDPQLLTNWRF